MNALPENAELLLMQNCIEWLTYGLHRHNQTLAKIYLKSIFSFSKVDNLIFFWNPGNRLLYCPPAEDNLFFNVPRNKKELLLCRRVTLEPSENK